MALLIYRNIDFKVAELITEGEFTKLKKDGLCDRSDLPNFINFHFSNSIVLGCSLMTYLLNEYYLGYYSDFIWTIGKILLLFWIPKVLIESYMYVKYKFKENAFKKKLTILLNYTTSYSQFRYDYDNEFIKSKFGKWLIKTLRK